MNYEQKYKEALERARTEYKNHEAFKGFCEMLVNIFPELKDKESEDEKVIRDIKVVLECSATKFFIEEGKMPIWYDRAIAWLEKQDESDETKAKEFLINKGYPIDANDVFPTYEEMYNIIREGLEQQSGQNLVNGVELKFNVGDWVVNKFGDSWHIDSFDKQSYRVSDGKGNYNYFSILHQDDMRLWTIEDAKDGDVLCLGSVIAIFKKYIGQEKCICYCSFCDNGGFEIPIEKGEDNVYGCTDTTPATKEQRDLLFAKMHEAGYEWDADKKEPIKL